MTKEELKEIELEIRSRKIQIQRERLKLQKEMYQSFLEGKINKNELKILKKIWTKKFQKSVKIVNGAKKFFAKTIWSFVKM